jgi:colicin import membrane protein
MHAADDRPEFAPPPEPALLRAFVLAVLAHLLLLFALMHGLQWKRDAQDAAVEAELWSALPQQAAPKQEPVQPAPPPPPPPPPPPAPPRPRPQPVVKAPPEPPVKSQADIALEREKQRRELERERRQAELEREKQKRELERERRQAELEHERVQKAKAEAQRKRDEELARKKEQQQQKLLAEAKQKEDERKARQQQQAAAEEKKRQQLREENLKRMQGMAGTGPSSATGSAANASGPSRSWAGRVQARVRPNIVFSDSVSGNPEARVIVRLGPGGLIIGKPQLVHSSGVPSWDEAVIRALEKTESLPADTDGRYPSPVEIAFRPKT